MVYLIVGVERVESGPERSLAALLIEQMMNVSIDDSDAWEKHSLVVSFCHFLFNRHLISILMSISNLHNCCIH